MLRDIRNRNCRGFLTILLLNNAVSLAGGILIVMLVPIPGLLDVSTGTVSALNLLMLPLQGLSPTAQRLKAGFAKAYGYNATTQKGIIWYKTKVNGMFLRRFKKRLFMQMARTPLMKMM